ncbi:MAG: hypothetical protein AUH68_00540 [Gemmatimonadetes bacterium 13_1_40CM_4_69_5]|nr:MAG: hypothetical protein AUH68_00540 [Gemmatimonadetes bacterium 13_1_40CM_4_69_5]
MRFLRCVHAEFLLVLPRFTRSRLGISLLALGATLTWLSTHGFDPLTAALQAGALGAIIGAVEIVGHADDRVALATALTHPTTSLALATGRWLAIVLPAAALTIACTAALGWQSGSAAAGLATAAAVAGCALTVVVLLGNTAALALFLFIAVAGTLAPERLVALAHPGVLRLTAASALELGPALWHYREIATGDLDAVLHALAWAGLGILLSSASIAHRRCHDS